MPILVVISVSLNPTSIFWGDVNLAQDWVKAQAPTIRVLVTHALSLCKRSATSRSKRVDFLKQFVHKLLSEAGRLMIMVGMRHHNEASVLLRNPSLWFYFWCQPVCTAKGFGSTRTFICKIAFQVAVRMRPSKLLSRVQQWDLHVRRSVSASVSLTKKDEEFV